MFGDEQDKFWSCFRVLLGRIRASSFPQGCTQGYSHSTPPGSGIINKTINPIMIELDKKPCN